MPYLPTLGQSLYGHGFCLGALADLQRAHHYHVVLRNGPDFILATWNAHLGQLLKPRAAQNRAHAEKLFKELIG